MATVNVHEAKTHLSRLLAQVEAGEEVIIARNGTPVARMVPAHETRPPATRCIQGNGSSFPTAFFDPLPEEEFAPVGGSADPLRLLLDAHAPLRLGRS